MGRKKIMIFFPKRLSVDKYRQQNTNYNHIKLFIQFITLA